MTQVSHGHVALDVVVNVSRHQKCGLNICCCARKLTMNGEMEGYLYPN